MSAAWTRKEGKNKKGGLNEKGRRSYPGTLRPPVKGAPKTPQELRRKGSFLARMGNAKGPERKPNGDPTRLLLSLRAWGASDKDDARKKSKRLLERYRKSQVKLTKKS
jgi:hypothetical protein